MATSSLFFFGGSQIGAYNRDINIFLVFFVLFFFFKPVSFLFFFVSEYYSEYKIKENKNETGLKNVKPRKFMNHNTYISSNIIITITSAPDRYIFVSDNPYP